MAAEDLLVALDRTLAGDKSAAAELVRAIRPAIQARVVRVLLGYRGTAKGRPPKQDLDDLVQHVFVQLFADGAKDLRAYDRTMGLAFLGYIGMLAEREVLSVLRSRRLSPFTEDPVTGEEFEEILQEVPSPEQAITQSDLLSQVVVRLREELSDKGAAIFELLVVEEHPVEHVCAVMRMSADAVYQWRKRIVDRAKTITNELSSDSRVPKRTSKGKPAHV